MFGLVSQKKYDKLMQQMKDIADSLKEDLQREGDRANSNEIWLEQARKDRESIRSEKTQFENRLRSCFWGLAQVYAVIETSFYSHMGDTQYSYRVSFRPQLKRPHGGTWGVSFSGCLLEAIDREKAILERLITVIRVGDWEYQNGMLSRSYSQVEYLLAAPQHIAEATKFLQEHLDKALQERQYQDILNVPGVEGGKQ